MHLLFSHQTLGIEVPIWLNFTFSCCDSTYLTPVTQSTSFMSFSNAALLCHNVIKLHIIACILGVHILALKSVQCNWICTLLLTNKKTQNYKSAKNVSITYNHSSIIFESTYLEGIHTRFYIKLRWFWGFCNLHYITKFEFCTCFCHSALESFVMWLKCLIWLNIWVSRVSIGEVGHGSLYFIIIGIHF